MRIGICGSHGTGKTTLARALAERFGLALINEQARIVALEMGFKSEAHLRGVPAISQLLFQQRVLKNQIGEEKRFKKFVSDRTTVDNAAYWLTWCHAMATSEERRQYIDQARDNALNSYDLVVYVPVEFGLEDDGFRGLGSEYQREIDHMVITLLRGWEIPYVVVRGSPEERVEQVLTEIQKKGLAKNAG